LAARVDREAVTFQQIESNIVRCPDAGAARKMIRLIEKMRRAGDSVGGIYRVRGAGRAPGWGEPVFDRLERTWLGPC